MATKILHKRGTAAATDALASGGNLNVSEIYYITDQGRISVGTSATTHVPLAKLSEIVANPMTTVGDLIIGGASGTQTRLAAGTNGYVLTMVGGSPSWMAATGGGGGGGGLKFTESETAPTSPGVGDMWRVPSTGSKYQRVSNAGGTAVWAEFDNAFGPASGSGYATIDFGSGQGSNTAQVSITGQTAITSAKFAMAVFAYVTLGNKTPNDHRNMSILAALICGPITDGVGFTIYATSQQKLTGAFTIRFSWD